MGRPEKNLLPNFFPSPDGRHPLEAASTNPHAIPLRNNSMNKAVDRSGTKCQLSTEKSTSHKLFACAVQPESRGSTGFESSQVLVAVWEKAVVHKNGCHLLLLLCINRTIREERENKCMFLHRRAGGLLQTLAKRLSADVFRHFAIKFIAGCAGFICAAGTFS